MARRKVPNGVNGQTTIPEACTGAYIRVFTDKQADEGFSLDAQRKRVAAYCVAQGWTLCPEHVYVDAGLSGKTSDRPQFRAMLRAAQEGRIQRVVSVKLDRLARNTKDFLATVDLLQGLGCDLVLIKESFDTSTPQGKFALTMFAALAELEVPMIAERTMSGRVQKAAQGGYNGAPVPFGYNYDGKAFTANAHAETVRSIFADFLAGKTMRQIAASLNAKGTPTARGGKWYASTVAYVLHNGFYAGFIQYNGSEVMGEHTTLVSVEDYERANQGSSTP